MKDDTRIVRKNFTFPAEYLKKIERLKRKHGAASHSELLRIAINRLDAETPTLRGDVEENLELEPSG